MTPDDSHFMLTSRIYEQRIVPRLYRRNHRKVKGVAAQNAWMRASKIAARYERLKELTEAQQ